MASSHIIEHDNDDKSEDTLIVFVNSDGTLTVDPCTLENVLANQRRATVSVIRIDGPDEPDSQTDKDTSSRCPINLTVEGYYPPPPIDGESKLLFDAFSNADPTVSSTVGGNSFFQHYLGTPTSPESIAAASVTSTSSMQHLDDMLSDVIQSPSIVSSIASPVLADGGVGDTLGDAFSEMDSEQIKRLETALHSEKAKQILGDEVTSMLDILKVNSPSSVQSNVDFDHCYTTIFRDPSLHDIGAQDETAEEVVCTKEDTFSSPNVQTPKDSSFNSGRMLKSTSSDGATSSDGLTTPVRKTSRPKKDDTRRRRAQSTIDTSRGRNLTDHDLRRMLETDDDQDEFAFENEDIERTKKVITKHGRQSTMINSQILMGVKRLGVRTGGNRKYVQTKLKFQKSHEETPLTTREENEKQPSAATTDVKKPEKQSPNKPVKKELRKHPITPPEAFGPALFSTPDIIKKVNSDEHSVTDTSDLEKSIGSVTRNSSAIGGDSLGFHNEDLNSYISPSQQLEGQRKEANPGENASGMKFAEDQEMLYMSDSSEVVLQETTGENEENPMIVKICRIGKNKKGDDGQPMQSPIRSTSRVRKPNIRYEVDGQRRWRTSESDAGEKEYDEGSFNASMEELEDSNAPMNENEDDPNKLWCICNKPHNNRFMICCDACDNWFHGYCVGISKAMGEKMEQNGTEWICPPCRKEKSLKERETKQRKLRVRDPSVQRRSISSDTPEISKLTETPRPSAKGSTSSQRPSSSTPLPNKSNISLTFGKVLCIGCKKNVLPTDGIYCSDECIDTHIAECLAIKGASGEKKEPFNPDERLIVCERKTGRLIAGPNAPSVGGVKEWLQNHRTFEIVRPGNLPTSKFYSPNKIPLKPKPIIQKPKESIKQVPALNVDRFQLFSADKVTEVKSPSTKKSEDSQNAAVKIIKVGGTEKSIKAYLVKKPQDQKSESRESPSTSDQNADSLKKKNVRPIKVIGLQPVSTSSASQPKTPKLQIPEHSPKLPPSSPKQPLPSPVRKRKDSEDYKPPPKAKKPEPGISRKSEESFKEDNSSSAGSTESSAIRQNVKKSLQELFHSRLRETTDLRLSEEEVVQLVNGIEEELHNLFKDTGMKYKSKYRSLLFNIKDKKNTLFLKIARKSLTPYHLVRLTPEELASQELAQWREREAKHEIDMIKKTELEMIAAAKTLNVLKTHKGEQEIETEEKVATTADVAVPDPTLDVDSVESKKPFQNYLKEKLLIGESSKEGKKEKKHRGDKHKRRDKDRHNKKHDRKKSSERHKKRHHHSSSSGGSRKHSHKHKDSAESDHKKPKSPERNVASEDEQKNEVSGTVVDPTATITADEEDLIQPDVELDDTELIDMEPTSTVVIPTPPYVASPVDRTPMWRGYVTMPDVTKFYSSVKPVSGNCGGLVTDLKETVECVGRISPSTVWEYISKMKKNASKEICLIRFDTDDETERNSNYMGFYSYLNNKNRMAVVGNLSKNIKDFYVFPLPSQSPIPEILLPIDGPGFGDFRSSNLLAGIIVRSKRSSSSSSSQLKHLKEHRPIMTPNDADTQIQVHPADNETFSPTPSPVRHAPLPKVASRVTTAHSRATTDESRTYSPKEEVAPALSTLTEKPTRSEPSELQKQMEELNRKIEEEKKLIKTISSNIDTDALPPGTYSPRDAPRSSDDSGDEIKLPSNIQQILDSIKKRTVEQNMPLTIQSDPIVSAYKKDTEAPYSPGEQPIIDDIDEHLEDIDYRRKRKSTAPSTLEQETRIDSAEIKVSRDPRQRAEIPLKIPDLNTSEPPPPGVEDEFDPTIPPPPTEPPVPSTAPQVYPAIPPEMAYGYNTFAAMPGYPHIMPQMYMPSPNVFSQPPPPIPSYPGAVPMMQYPQQVMIPPGVDDLPPLPPGAPPPTGAVGKKMGDRHQSSDEDEERGRRRKDRKYDDNDRRYNKRGYSGRYKDYRSDGYNKRFKGQGRYGKSYSYKSSGYWKGGGYGEQGRNFSRDRHQKH